MAILLHFCCKVTVVVSCWFLFIADRKHKINTNIISQICDFVVSNNTEISILYKRFSKKKKGFLASKYYLQYDRMICLFLYIKCLWESKGFVNQRWKANYRFGCVILGSCFSLHVSKPQYVNGQDLQYKQEKMCDSVQ